MASTGSNDPGGSTAFLYKLGGYAAFEEQLKGSIEPGKLADFVVIDRDYMKCPEEEIKDICSLQTVVGGEVVYETK